MQQGGCESAVELAGPWASRSPNPSLTHGGSGGKSGCLLTSSFMGTLALAFLSAESGRKVGQSAAGFTEGERKGERDPGRPEPNMG